MKKIIMLLIFCIILIMTTSCKNSNEHQYDLLYDEEISNISIVYLSDEDIYCSKEKYKERIVETTIIENVDSFLLAFSQIKFRNYLLGDPMELYSGYAIQIEYTNNDCEFINCYAQALFVGENYEFGKVYCDENIFYDFLNNYIDINNENIN